MSNDEKRERIYEIKRILGKRLFIPGHHYQRDEVIEFADATGDSLQLAQLQKQIKRLSISSFVAFILWQRRLIC